MLIHYNQISDILYYEVLDIPLPELQGLKNLKVIIHNVRLLKQSTIGDMLNELKAKVELSYPDAKLRLLEVLYHKIYKNVQNFGEPFLLAIHVGETLADVKLRIQKKLQVPDEEFAKWKFAFMSLGCPNYLQDSDILFNRFQRRDVYGAWEQYLGLEH